jgi:hypothetical protein
MSFGNSGFYKSYRIRHRRHLEFHIPPNIEEKRDRDVLSDEIYANPRWRSKSIGIPKDQSSPKFAV